MVVTLCVVHAMLALAAYLKGPDDGKTITLFLQPHRTSFEEEIIYLPVAVKSA